MKFAVSAVLLFAASGVTAQTPHRDYPGCDLAAQHATRGSGKDAGQAHIAMRADVLQADIGNARKARRLTQAQADAAFRQVDQIRHASDGYARRQGFLSAGERASYDRELDAIAMRLCRV